MKAFAFVQASTVEEAVDLVSSSPSAAFLAGGTNLVDLMKLGVHAPELLVDVNRLGLDRIDEDADGGLRIGAGVKNSDLAAHLGVRRRFPVLAEALLNGASGQLRNAATVGGNLLQRTRCLYFQDTTKPCNKRAPGTGCPARVGEHRNLAVMGWSDSCVATNPSDMAVALTALGAVVHVRHAQGSGAVPIGDLYRLPGDEPERDTTLGPGSLITGVQLPPLGFSTRSAYRKVRDRASYAFAVASVAAALDVADGVVRDVRLAFGAVAPVPWRATRAEEALRGQPATEDNFRRAAEVELAVARPLRDNAFKLPLVRNIVTRTLAGLAGVQP